MLKYINKVRLAEMEYGEKGQYFSQSWGRVESHRIQGVGNLVQIFLQYAMIWVVTSSAGVGPLFLKAVHAFFLFR